MVMRATEQAGSACGQKPVLSPKLAQGTATPAHTRARPTPNHLSGSHPAQPSPHLHQVVHEVDVKGDLRELLGQGLGTRQAAVEHRHARAALGVHVLDQQPAHLARADDAHLQRGGGGGRMGGGYVGLGSEDSSWASKAADPILPHREACTPVCLPSTNTAS